MKTRIPTVFAAKIELIVVILALTTVPLTTRANHFDDATEEVKKPGGYFRLGATMGDPAALNNAVSIVNQVRAKKLSAKNSYYDSALEVLKRFSKTRVDDWDRDGSLRKSAGKILEQALDDSVTPESIRKSFRE